MYVQVEKDQGAYTRREIKIKKGKLRLKKENWNVKVDKWQIEKNNEISKF